MLDTKTSEDITYERLKELAVNNQLPVGEFLSQRKLADRVGASVVTLRNSLRRLENEGLIENVPKWGVRIPIETEETIRDRYFLREILEIAAVKRMYELNHHDYKQEIFETAKKCDSMKGNSEEDIKQFAQMHMKFHLLIVKCSKSEMLVKSFERLNIRSIMFWNAKRGWALGKQRNKMHHTDLVKIIFSGDIKKAIKEIRNHIKDGLKNELEAFKNNL